jgi:hypothetical protein
MLTFTDILKAVVPEFDIEQYNYNYWDGDYYYNHSINYKVVSGVYDTLEILDRIPVECEDYYSENMYLIFKYASKYYRIEYFEGSQGMNYKVDKDSFKEVFPKEVTKIIYE